MKKTLSHIFLPILFLFAVLHVNAQQGSILISGKISNAEDQQPLHAVSVSILKKGIGTSTNLTGQFALIIPFANIKDSLKISCIGFKVKVFPIAELKNGEELNITLEKNSTELHEVSIGFHDAVKMIQKAIDKIPENYINHPHVIRGFYRMYTYNDKDPLELSEAVFDVFNFGYADKRADLFRLIKSRNEKNDRDFGSMELGQKPNSVFEDDIVNHIYASGLLSDEGLKNHQFDVRGTEDIKGHEAYQIDFQERPGVTERSFRGTMYIDAKTYAFIYFDYGLSPAGLKDIGSSTFVKHSVVSIGDVNLDLENDHTKISYQEVGDKWVLSDVEGDDALHIKGTDVDMVAHVKFNYQVTAVDVTQTTSFNSKIGRNENINEHESDSGLSFWKDYNILLSDYNTEDIFKQIGAINKAAKEKK